MVDMERCPIREARSGGTGSSWKWSRRSPSADGGARHQARRCGEAISDIDPVGSGAPGRHPGWKRVMAGSGRGKRRRPTIRVSGADGRGLANHSYHGCRLRSWFGTGSRRKFTPQEGVAVAPDPGHCRLAVAPTPLRTVGKEHRSWRTRRAGPALHRRADS